MECFFRSPVRVVGYEEMALFPMQTDVQNEKVRRWFSCIDKSWGEQTTAQTRDTYLWIWYEVTNLQRLLIRIGKTIYKYRSIIEIKAS